MELPAEVVKQLQGEFVAETRPFCFLIDGDHRLVDSWGDSSWTGLSDLDNGTDMLDRAPWLHGTLDTERQRLNFVSNAHGAVMHIVTIPHDSGHYCVFLDAGAAHEHLQLKQQAANELKLLHASQQKLISRQRDLIAELVETKAELDHRRRDIERSSAGKSRFIAMMSHEFRTPLASIINYADLALEPESGPDQMRKSIEAIARSSHHLTSLVEAVLDEARLDAGNVPLRERNFDLFALLDDLASMMAPLAAEKGLAFATFVNSGVPEKIHADDVCLRQILTNLLGNAVKYTVDGGIRLYVTFHGGTLVATVSDTGPGISAADQERVFQAFERGSDQQHGRTGAGLGLTITLQLARLMNGEISLDSSPGEGCTVSVHVPVTEAVSEVSEEELLLPPTEATYASRPTSVLICDDDEDMLALVEHYLHRAGYGLITAASGTEAIEKALAYEPDIVLMDVNLPGTNGIDAATRLRDGGFDRPIVAVTASRLSEDDSKAFTRCFRKPAPMQQLLSEIKALTH